MSKLRLSMTMSLDGYVAGPDPSDEEPLGIGGEDLHEWVVKTKSWREGHGEEGGEEGPESDLVQEWIDRAGATIMGRKMFSGGEGSWDDDSKRDGWCGDEPPFHHPVFILTHHERESQEMEGGTTFNFVTDGIESAIEQARAAAGEKDVQISGGANVIQQALAAGLLDDIQISVAPILLGGGTPLFGGGTGNLELDRVVDAPGVTHLRYRVRR